MLQRHKIETAVKNTKRKRASYRVSLSCTVNSVSVVLNKSIGVVKIKLSSRHGEQVGSV